MDDDARFMARTPAGEPYELCNLYAAYAEGEGGSPKPQMVRKMRGWGFSWLALLLTPLYLLYRKQYLAAGCWIAVSFGADFLSKSLSTVVGMLFFLASLVFGMAFYSLYRVSAERAMDRAFEQGATNVREALAYVRRCGGTSFAAVAWVSQWCSRSPWWKCWRASKRAACASAAEAGRGRHPA